MAKLGAGVRKRADGTLEKRFSVKGVRYSVYGKNSKELSEKEQELRGQIKENSYINNHNITLDKYHEEWKNAKRGTIKESTELVNENRYKKHIKPALGNKKIVDIEKRELVHLQKELSEKLSPSTVNLIFTHIKMILNDAVNDGIIIKSPAVGIKPLKVEKKATDTIHRALTVEEQKLFMQEIKNDWYYELIALLLCTGMRIGECTALTWQDIDYKNNVIHITKTVTRKASGEYIVGTPKSKTSNRDIPMNDTIKEILKSQREKQNAIRGNVIGLKQNVFENLSGGMVYNNSVKGVIVKALERINKEREIIEYFSIHALRDTFATRYIEQGGSPQVLKTILGHSSLAMTMDLYSQVLPNTKQKEMDSIKIAF